MRALLAVVALLIGCAPEGVELRQWTLDGRTIALPSNGVVGELPGPNAYALRTTKNLDAEQRGQALTLVLLCFHGTLDVRINDRLLVDVGDSGVGEHRYVIEPELTAGGQLDITLEVHTDAIAFGFGVPPKLMRGEIVRPTSVAVFNRQLAVIDLGLIGVFSALFGLSYLLDRRRRQDLAFAGGVLASASAPLLQLGVLLKLGPWLSVALGISVCITNIAIVYFLHYSFQLKQAPPRWLIRSFLALMVVSVGTLFSSSLFVAWNALFLITFVALAKYVLTTLLRQARSGTRRTDALVLLVTLFLLFALATPEFVSLALGHNLYGGIHILPLGAISFAVAQALHLARDQASRQRALEQTTEELRRQVAERSRELADALAQLSQKPTTGLEVDRTIDGRYRVIKKLGAGGMGAVYEVERLSDGERLALKTLRGRSDSDAMARFAREAQIAAQIDHPHLVPALDVGIADGQLFLVMPLITGGSLEHARADFGNAAWAKPLLRQVAKGLAALHERDIVHRDLKPANILIASGQAQIADFGLAALRAEQRAETMLSDDAMAKTASPPLTRAGDLFGTPDYMAPELASGTREAKPSSDIFSFGIIAYEMLTGQTPFPEPPLIARLHGRAIVIPSNRPVDPLVMRCLSTDPAKRPTANELANSL